MTSRLHYLAALIGVATLAACGSAPDSSGDNVASLGTTTTTDTGEESPDSSTPDSVDPEDAFNAYAQCMRDEGVDLPDPQVVSADAAGGGNGGRIIVNSEAAAESPAPGGTVIDFAGEEFQAAEKICRPILDDAFGDIEIDPEVLAEQREQMLNFAECMREQGIDYPDPIFSDDGGVTIGVGSADDRDLPFDPESDEWQAASEACGDFLAGGFVGAPIAQGGE